MDLDICLFHVKHYKKSEISFVSHETKLLNIQTVSCETPFQKSICIFVSCETFPKYLLYACFT